MTEIPGVRASHVEEENSKTLIIKRQTSEKLAINEKYQLSMGKEVSKLTEDMNGMKIRCEIDSYYVEDGLLVFENDQFYVCQNVKRGDGPSVLYGYSYGWRVTNSGIRDITNMIIILDKKRIIESGFKIVEVIGDKLLLESKSTMITLNFQRGEFQKKGYDNKTDFYSYGRLGSPSLKISKDGHEGEPTNELVVLDKDNQPLSYINGSKVIQIFSDKNEMLILQDNKLLKIKVTESGHNYKTVGKRVDLGIGKIIDIKMDTNENFYVVLVEGDNQNKIFFLDTKSLKVHKHLDTNIDKGFFIDDKGFVVGYDVELNVETFFTNFDSYPKGYTGEIEIFEQKIEDIKVTDKSRADLKELLENGGLSIDMDKVLNGVDEDSGDEFDDEKLIQTIWASKFPEFDNKTLRQLLDEADSVEDMKIVNKIVKQISKNPTVASVKGLIVPMQSVVFEKTNQIKLKEIFDKMTTYQDQFATNKEFGNLLHLKNKLTILKEERSKIAIAFCDDDKKLNQFVRSIDKAIEEYHKDHEDKIIREIEEQIKDLELYMDNIDSIVQISAVYTTDYWKNAMDQLQYLSKAKKKEYKEKLNKLVQAKNASLQKEEKKKLVEKQATIEDIIKQIDDHLDQLGGILLGIHDQDTLEAFRFSDPLVNIVNEKIAQMPDTKKQVQEIKLDNLFRERSLKIKLEQHETKGVKHSLDQYGIDTFLYYSASVRPTIGRDLTGIRTGNDKVKLQLELDNGNVYNADTFFQNPSKYGRLIIGNGVEFEMSQQDFLKLTKKISFRKSRVKKEYEDLSQQLMLGVDGKDEDEKKKTKDKIRKRIEKIRKDYKGPLYLELLVRNGVNKMDLEPRPNVPQFDPNFVILEEEREFLRIMTNRFVMQLDKQKGIDIIEGGPGLGKTEICRFLASVTNREIARVQCAKMDPTDMFFSPQLKKGETTREPADWIKQMQKPGSIILFDEIDKLSEQCFERLHPLFDGGRSVYDPQIGKVKAHPTCIFVGTRNSYELMSNPIVSRSRIKFMEYPSLKNEAYKISKYTDNVFIRGLENEEFLKLWKEFIEDKTKPSNKNQEEIYNLFVAISHIAQIFAQLRVKFDSDDFNEKFEYEISYRDASDIFVDYNYNKDIKKSILDILIPKSRAVVKLAEDKDIQEDIVTKVVNGLVS